MREVVSIYFKKGGHLYYFDPNGLNLNKDDNVIVETEKGPQFATVSIPNTKIDKSKLPLMINKVKRICTKKDIANNNNNITLAKKALKKCKEMVEEQKLNMIVLDARYNFDKTQLMFVFMSDNRVDFRKLAKDLSQIYKTRIELKQVGVRDKAKEIGGYGFCGRELCCARFLNDFDTVSINMAKNQNIALNPTKINGICGRLLCCLKYEDECYREYNKNMPKVGKKISTDMGDGKVISIDPLKQTYKVDLKEQGIVEIKVNESN